MENQLDGVRQQSNIVIVDNVSFFMTVANGRYAFEYLGEGRWSAVGEIYWSEDYDEDNDEHYEVAAFSYWGDWGDREEQQIVPGDIFWLVETPKMPKLALEDVL